MYSFLENDNSVHKKAKAVNKNNVATISHGEYKDVLLYNKCLKHSLDKIQTKNYRIGPYEINKTSLSCLVEKIYILNKRYDG